MSISRVSGKREELRISCGEWRSGIGIFPVHNKWVYAKPTSLVINFTLQPEACVIVRYNWISVHWPAMRCDLLQSPNKMLCAMVPSLATLQIKWSADSPFGFSMERPNAILRKYAGLKICTDARMFVKSCTVLKFGGERTHTTHHRRFEERFIFQHASHTSAAHSRWHKYVLRWSFGWCIVNVCSGLVKPQTHATCSATHKHNFEIENGNDCCNGTKEQLKQCEEYWIGSSAQWIGTSGIYIIPELYRDNFCKSFMVFTWFVG